MYRFRSALVVVVTPGLLEHLCAWLEPAGWLITTADSYAPAKYRLELGADLLVTELELGDYNGLQLALRAQNAGVPSVVVGREDPVLEREAEQLGSVYIRRTDLNKHQLLVAIDAGMAASKSTLPPISRNVEFARRPWPVKLSASARRLPLN